MNTLLIAISGVSILLNLIFFSLVFIFMARKGGLSYIGSRLSDFKNPNPNSPSYIGPYYTHRCSQLEQLPVNTTDIVLLGDSITDEGEWAELLSSDRIKNRGIAADTTAGLLKRLDSILEGKPQTLLLMIGVNDVLNEGMSPIEVSENYREILAKIQAAVPGATVFVQSVLPVDEGFLGRNTNIKIKAVNAQLQALSEDFSYQYIDLFSQFIDEAGQLDKQYTLDGVHLNGLAYQRWKQVLMRYLML